MHRSRAFMLAIPGLAISILTRTRRRQLIFVILALLGLAALSRPLLAQTRGPGLPSISFSPAELFTPLSIIRTTNGAGEPRGNGLATMHKGYLALPYGVDSGGPGGGFAFYDISNPRSPQLVSRFDRDELREAHGFARSNSYPGSYVVLQSVTGIEIWDWTDIRNPQQLSQLHLPNVEPTDYTTGAWWVAWQAPYVFVGASGNGLYVVDATDARNPYVVKHLPISATGGFRIHTVFPVGNLLVATSADFSGTSTGIVTIDISDPRDPVVIKSQRSGVPRFYSAFFNGNTLVGLGNQDRTVHFWDLSNPAEFGPRTTISGLQRPVYATVQDGHALVGEESGFVKIDFRSTPPTIVGRGTSGVDDRSEDIVTPLGNLALVSNDHGTGSAIIAHQAAPDTTGPTVTMVDPPNQASNQKLTSRIGVTLSDWYDLDSVTQATFIVRPLGGAALAGKYSGEQGILNFWPDAPLQPGTTYEVVFPAGGVRDFSGNGMPATFTSRFSTLAADDIPRVQVQPRGAEQVGQSIAFTLIGSGGTGPLMYSWDFGDGSPPTALSSSPAASYTYATPGHYPVKVSVHNSYSRSSSSYTQTIYHPLTSGVPASSGTILLDQPRQRVWVVNSDTDTVTAIDAAAHTRLFERPVGRGPQALAQAPDGAIWVTNLDDSTISVLHRDTGQLIRTVALAPGIQPYGIAFSPDGRAAYVSTQGTGQLLKLDPASAALVGALDLPGPARGIAITHDSSRLLVARFVSPSAQGEVIEVDLRSFQIAEVIPLSMSQGPDGNTNGRGVPNYLSSIVISPDGREARIPSKKDNIARGLHRDGQPLSFESTVRTIVSTIDLGAGAEALSRRVDLNDRDLASAVAYSPLGDYVFVATQGSNTVEVFDAYNQQLMTGVAEVGRAPQGLIITPDGTKLYVQNLMSRSVSVYDISGVVSSTTNAMLHLSTIPTIAVERLAPQVLRGKLIFYNAQDRRMSRDGYLSCASCHLDGGSDGRVWDFTDRGEGLRNTTTLHGRAGMLHGNLHATGNFDELQDFEGIIRAFFGGSGFMDNSLYAQGSRSAPLGDRKAGVSADLDALAAYVASLGMVSPSPFRSPDGALTAEAQQGRLAFTQLQCYTCHAGPAFTDSPGGFLHDVGTIQGSSGQRLGEPLTGLDTPTLLGIWETAPFLHDGSAATLQDVLSPRGGESPHNVRARLSSAQLDQLVAYLRQIDARERADPPSLLYTAKLAPTQRGPAIETSAAGHAKLVLGPDRTTAFLSLSISGLSSPQIRAAIEGSGARAGEAVHLALPLGTLTNHRLLLTAEQVQHLRDGRLSIRISTNRFPDGEIRGQLNDPNDAPYTAFLPLVQQGGR